MNLIYVNASSQFFDKLKNVSYVKNIKIALKNADLVIIHTEWNDFKSLNFKALIKKKKGQH